VATLDVQVVDAAGSPMQAVVAGANTTNLANMNWLRVTGTDPAGRLRLHVPPGDHVLYATTGSQHALAFVDRTQRDAQVLRLAPLPTMRVTVRDRDGKPVAGARAQVAGFLYPEPRGDAEQVALGRAAISLHAGYVANARSDKGGLLLVPAFMCPGMESGIVVRLGTRASKSFSLVPDGEAELVLDP